MAANNHVEKSSRSKLKTFYVDVFSESCFPHQIHYYWKESNSGSPNTTQVLMVTFIQTPMLVGNYFTKHKYNGVRNNQSMITLKLCNNSQTITDLIDTNKK